MAVLAAALAVLALTRGGERTPAEATTAAAEATTTPPTAAPTAEATPSPTPDDLPTFEPPEPTPTVPEEELALQSLRESAAWVNLAEWDRALTGRRLFQIHNEVGAVAEFANAEELWNEAIPPLREEMLLMARDEGIEPESVRFRGLPVEDANVSGVLRWFTNETTEGRGMMFAPFASYLTSEGESRYRSWPVLIAAGVGSDDTTVGTHVGTGPAVDFAVADLPGVTEELDVIVGARYLDWLRAQDPVVPAANPTCPEAGCGL